MNRVLRYLPRPVPIDVDYAHLPSPEAGGGVATIIMRTWEPGDTDRCRLCPADQCNGRGRTACMVVALEYVEAEAAWLFSAHPDRPELAGRSGGDER